MPIEFSQYESGLPHEDARVPGVAAGIEIGLRFGGIRLLHKPLYPVADPERLSLFDVAVAGSGSGRLDADGDQAVFISS